MQQDVLQQTVEAIARTDGVTRIIAIFLAAVLVFVMVGGWLLIAYQEQARLTVATLVRLACLFGFSYVVGKVLGHIVIDPRPYIVEHVAPLMPVAKDNGFPSDHTLLASALTAGTLWLNRRWSVLFVLGTILVMLGRLGVGAHHTLDVMGSVVIVMVVSIIVGLVPLPSRWNCSWRVVAQRVLHSAG
ncbi:MAG: phosphatase PAP2 family protein [Chloroflexi bacterium]|nr:phosphatase PAP2 family protein [Chloroflexota bacterium]